MKRMHVQIIAFAGVAVLVAAVAWRTSSRSSPDEVAVEDPVSITIDYPLEGSIFPPEFPAPTWQWRDPDDAVDVWEITVSFADGTVPIRVKSVGAPLRIGDIDPRAVSSTNEPPSLTATQAAAHTWMPEDGVWSVIKDHSTQAPATVIIRGYRSGELRNVASHGRMTLKTSTDPVGAPIFYRDVPLMPSELEKGVIKPLAPDAVPLIAWRLRNVEDTKSRVLMEDLHTCANCHSFSTDGKTLGLDIDGPRNDKGLYAVIDIEPEMAIRNEDLIQWSAFRGNLGSKLRVGFMSQISPDARYVMTTVHDPGVDQTDAERHEYPVDLVSNYYVANFGDYRFLQVFYPTRGVLSWYDRKAKRLEYLPGADDPQFVHANATWSPDGEYLIFARAKAQDANPENAPTAAYAMDPKELQIRYDLYRISFNEGKGGTPEPIAGASQNGMSNSFPKISPDGRWLVYVQSKNGLLMRPDSELYIVPASGGTARRMTCNTSLMNSWHSFSPNGRWLVFSSKSRSPYTQMFLTHIDEAGGDSPAILIENATAANRAVNIPEFVNIPENGMMKIETPAADYARYVDSAVALMKERNFEEAEAAWNAAIEIVPEDWRAHNSLGVVLIETGKAEAATFHYREAIRLNPRCPEAHNNLGQALAEQGEFDKAIAQFEKAVELKPDYTVAHANLGLLHARMKHPEKAIAHLKRVVEATPDAADARRNLGHALSDVGDLQEASLHLEAAVKLSGGGDPLTLHLLGRVYDNLGRAGEAVQIERMALESALAQNNPTLIRAVKSHLDKLLANGKDSALHPR